MDIDKFPVLRNGYKQLPHRGPPGLACTGIDRDNHIVVVSVVMRHTAVMIAG